MLIGAFTAQMLFLLPFPNTERNILTFYITLHFTLSGGLLLLAELLSQLSSVRSRTAAAHSISTQLQQLEMQLHSTRSAVFIYI